MIRKLFGLAAFVAGFAVPAGVAAENLTTGLNNTYGTPGGLIEMPTAEMAPDGQLSSTVAYFDGFTRTTLSFQITPRLTGSFRYTGTEDFSPNFSTYYDRSFDLRFRLINERKWLPAVAIGLQDFVGTGVLSGEYIVATKSIGDRLRVTGGVGWGRLGSYGSDASFGTRAPFSFAGVGSGGSFNADSWFRGDMALFGGASFRINDKLSFSAEYSSDAYDIEKSRGIIKRSSPWNFALDYQWRPEVNLRAFALHGDEIGAAITLSLNPKNPSVRGGSELAPLPVAVRPKGSAAELGWSTEPVRRAAVAASIERSLDQTGIDLEAVRLDATSAHVVIRNETYDAQSQALGRTLRRLSRELPASVEMLHVTLVRNGIPLSTMTMRRSDLERLENASASEALAAARFTDTLRFGDFPEPLPDAYPRFEWTIGPYLRTSLFDPVNPLRADVGCLTSAPMGQS